MLHLNLSVTQPRHLTGPASLALVAETQTKLLKAQAQKA